MARTIGQLTSLKASKLTKPGLHADGGNLYLRVSTTGSKSWIFRYMRYGRSREMGLGAFHTVSLQHARNLATEARTLLQKDLDPIAVRQRQRTSERLQEARRITFNQCAKDYIENHKAGWKNKKHANQWTNTLEKYANPLIGHLPVQEVDIEAILKVLQPIWYDKTETASRLRGRIETILDAARVKGYREGENPARWKGNLDKILPTKSRIQKVQHHAALPFRDAPAFVQQLQTLDTAAANALLLTMFTGARTKEVLEAKWDEIDIENRIWTIPADRMKGGVEHRVPMTDQVVKILEKQRGKSAQFIFPGQKKGKPLSNGAMPNVLKRLGRDGQVTVHGFRSTIRDWASEKGNYSHEVMESILAHKISNKVEAAYRRGDLLEKRRELLNHWCRYCLANKAMVIPLTRAN